MPTSGWPRIRDRLKPKRKLEWNFWWAATAVAATVMLVWVFFPLRHELSAQDVLEKAEAVPETAGGEILFTTSKYRFARPAVLEAGNSEARFQHVRALFVQANYSWTSPLSARSFAAWRQHLSEKRDSVTSIRDDGGRQFYRVRTRTDSDILHSASLTLEAASYRPTKASFEFRDEDLIEVSEQAAPTPNTPQKVPTVQPKVTETLVTTEDELRVFAALDAIGVDAEEPIDVKLDAGSHSVLVTGIGVPTDRRKQIETALASSPNTVVRFSSSQAVRGDADASDSSTAADSDAPFRQKLQTMAGGARQLQTITDNTLDISNALFAQSHWLLVLAQQFPPPVESSLSSASANTLLALRQRRLGAMSYALRRLRDQLHPLLADEVTITVEAQPWQNLSVALYESTRNLDRLVGRLLAGSYDAQEGEMMLKELPDDISKVDMLILASSK
jgi:hypothetical protein